MDKKWHKCSICHRRFFGYGNNPEPIHRFEQRCCDDCNWGAVIPMRMHQIRLREQAQGDDKTAKGDSDKHDLP